MPLILTWRKATTLPVAASGLTPEALATLSTTDVERLPIRVGNSPVSLAELFQVAGSCADRHLVLEGDLSPCRRIGHRMNSGTLTIQGDAGSFLGAEMSGGRIEVNGAVGAGAGAEMRGGVLHVHGDAGDDLGAAYSGSRRGMRDGVILVEGKAGNDVALAMRRGFIAIGGAAGNGLGRNLIAGSVFAFGTVGAFPGAGMKRGTLALFGLANTAEPDLLPTFAESGRYRPPFLSLFLRRLQAWGFPVPGTAFSGSVERYNGDLAGGGQGEILVGL